MKLFAKVKVFVFCISFFIQNLIFCSESSYGNSPLLEMQKGKLLGLKLSLPVVYQKPVSDVLLTANLIKKILTDPESLWPESEKINSQESTLDLEEDLTNNFPFRFFDICTCMPEEFYVTFAKQVVDRAIVLYQKKDPKKPFVYGSFASGGLFPDLYILTKFVKELRDRKIKNIHVQVNLVDTDLRDYIWQHSGGVGRVSVENESVHAHMLYFKPTKGIEFSNTDDASELLIKFLQWFTQNLKIKLDLYIYGTGQNYVYDHEKNRVLSHDMLIAMDYYPESQGDLAQLALRTVKKGGYLCSLDNKAPKEIVFEEGLVIPSSYKELAQLAKTEAEEAEELDVEAIEEAISEELGSDVSWSTTEKSEGDDDFPVYITMSEKIVDISAETFKALLQRARGDNTKIGRLFAPLFYPESKILMYQSKELQKSLKFNPLDYFSVNYSSVMNVIENQEATMLNPKFDPVHENEKLSLYLGKIIKAVKAVRRMTQ